MAETLISSEVSQIGPIDMETFRSRLKEISEMQTDPSSDSSETSVSDRKNLVKDWSSEFEGKLKPIELEESGAASLGLEDLELYLEQLKKEIWSAEEENLMISNEIDVMTRTLASDSSKLDGDLESLTFSLNLLDTQGLHYFQAGEPNGKSFSGDPCESLMKVSEDYKFEILELDQQIEKSRISLTILQELDFVFKRVETIDQIEDRFCVVKIIEFQGSYMRLSLKTPIPSPDGLLRHKLDCLVEPPVLDHELLIEFVDKTMELKNMEIFPSDISLDVIINTVKSSRHLPILLTGSTLGCLVRQVQRRIVLCTLRRLLVKDANKSRHSFEYSDRDDTVTAHLVGGIDAFIKISQGWPVSGSALKLVSIRNSDTHSSSISLSFLCKVKELANSLDTQTCSHLVRFVDALEEILIREMRSELHSNSIPT